jgi:hypothetical protein
VCAKVSIPFMLKLRGLCVLVGGWGLFCSACQHYGLDQEMSNSTSVLSKP